MDYDLDIYSTMSQFKAMRVTVDSIPAKIILNTGAVGPTIQIASAINIGVNTVS